MRVRVGVVIVLLSSYSLSPAAVVVVAIINGDPLALSLVIMQTSC